MESLKKRLQEAAPDGRLTCPEAFKIASDEKCSAAEVGQACNELKIKINSCQLGCF